MRISVVGNCQVLGLANTFALMMPGADVQTAQVHTLQPPEAEAAADAASTADLVVSQPLTETYGPLATDQLGPRCARMVLVPNIYFEGFHPDATYVGGVGGRLPSPMGAYHSYIVLRGVLLGRSESAIVEDFNDGTFQSLGYVERWQSSRVTLEQRSREIGFPVERILDGWAAKSPFMLTFNHPRIQVLAHLAEIALELAGIRPGCSAQWAAAAIASDLTSAPVWPIYPGVAAFHGFPEAGSFLFKRERRMGTLDLAGFVRESMNGYSGVSVDRLEPRTRQLRDDFRRLVAEGATA